MKSLLLSIFISLSIICQISAQVPFAFRYQASVRNEDNKAIKDEVTFKICLYSDANRNVEIYCEEHTTTPDINGLVAFSIGEGESLEIFSDIVWGDGPYYIEVSLDNEVISYSQLLSVPYAMHAQSANKLHNLQNPILDNDPATKSYVDANLWLKIEELQNALSDAETRANAYADSLSISPKELEISDNGDTLILGNKQIILEGLRSQNTPKYTKQLVLGGSYNEELTQVLHTSDSGFLLLCTTFSGNGNVQNFKGNADIWLIKISKKLEIEWTKTLGGSGYDNGELVIEESDGYLIGATTESKDGDIDNNKGEFDIWLVKVNKSGDIIWNRTYGGAGTEFLNAIIPNNNGTYYIGATTFSNDGDIPHSRGESDIWIFKTNDLNEIAASATFGGASFDGVYTMSKSENNNLELYGSSDSNDGDILSNNGALDFIHLVLNPSLELIQQNCYGTTANEQLQIKKMNILAGHSYPENMSGNDANSLKNIFIQKIEKNEFSKTIGGNQCDIIQDLILQNDTIILLTHSASQDGDISNNKGGSDIVIIQIAPNGEIIKTQNLGGTYDETAKTIKLLPSGGFLVAGESESLDGNLSSNSGGKDIWVIKTNNRFEIIWQKNFGGSYNEVLQDIHIIDDNNFILFGTTSSNDYGITGLHDKAGKSSDIWILNTHTK